MLLSTHGGNGPALDAAITELSSLTGAVAYAPRGDVGPDPGTYSGAWLTSVMLALRPDLVDVDHASSDLAAELQTASPERGREHIDHFIESIVDSVDAVRRH